MRSSLLAAALVLSAAALHAQQAPTFYLGADVSALAAVRGEPFVYRENGQVSTEYDIMRAHGWNAFRLRVFVSPVREAPNNSLENTIALAKKIKATGATLMLDIHYSDTWADPGHQDTPVAWRSLDVAGMERQVEEYSRDVIAQLKAAGAMPDMVQVGNETTGGFLWPLGHLHVPSSDVKQAGSEPMRGGFLEPYNEDAVWSNVTRFLKAGVRGVMAGAGNTPPKIILHIDCGGDWQVTKWWFDHIEAAGVPYDIIGQSFYPKYHGTLPMLEHTMTESMQRYHKPFLVVETGYVQHDTAAMSTPERIAQPLLSAKTPREKGFMQWPGTPQGQLQFMADIITTVKRNNGMGVFYWGPEGRWGDGMWNPDGTPAPSIFVLDHLNGVLSPKGTKVRLTTAPPVPAGRSIYIAGSFNGWNPSTAPLTRGADGTWQATLDESVRGGIEFKFTLGSWATVETTASGADVPNHTFTIPASGAATIDVSVAGWHDSSAAAAAAKPNTASKSVSVLSESFSIPQLGRNRRVWVYLPTDYAKSTRRYPVLYMHDGQNVFDAATSFAGEWGVDETLDSLRAKAIVVAVDNGGTHRMTEYNPWKATNPSLGGGEGEQYIEFLAGTLKPQIDRKYRTLRDPAHTGIMGSSMGGLISLYGVLKRPDVFGRAGVFSCACWVARPYVYEFARKSGAPHKDARIFFIAGEYETKDGEPARDQREMVDTLVAAGWKRDVNVRSIISPDGKHNEAFWRREFPAAFRWLFE